MNIENLHMMIIRGVFYTSILISIGDIILKQKISLVNSRDDETYFIEAFRGMKIYILAVYAWTLISMFLNYKEHGWVGALINMFIGLGLNGIFIYFYMSMMRSTADKYGFSRVRFSMTDVIISLAYVLVLTGIIFGMYNRSKK